MFRYFSTILTALMLAAVCILVGPAQAAAQPVQPNREEPPETRIKREGTGLRVGLLINHLFAAREVSPIVYFDLGLEHRVGEYYFEFRAPSLAFIPDGLITLLTIGFRDNPEPIFFMLNGDDIPSHWELAHTRLGYRFRIIPPGDSDLLSDSYEAVVGLFASADFVMFEARRDLEEVEAQNLGYQDPFVLGAGGFFTIGRPTNDMRYDLTVGGGMAFPAFNAGQQRRVFLFTSDVNVQWELKIRGAFYLRPRLTAYITDTEPRTHFGGGLTAGWNLRF